MSSACSRAGFRWPAPTRALDEAVAAARACRICAAELPLGPRPVLLVRATSRLLIVSQAPGTRVHETGLPFNDRSGDRLRGWLGIDRDTFYDHPESRHHAGWPVLSRASTRRAATARR